MKNPISDILNSLFSSPSDKTGLLKGNGAVSPKGSQSNGNTFEDVLAQLATQDAGTSNPPATGDSNGPAAAPQGGASSAEVSTLQNNGSFFESLTSISEVNISISEHLKVSNLDQLAQAEQSLTSLAVGLAKLLSLLSNLQSTDLTQAQNTLVSVSGGTISPDDAKSLLTTLQSMTQKLSDEQNPLLLTPDQQSAFLNQMLQQMVQNQQLLFGTVVASPSSSDSNSSIAGASGASTSIQTSDVFLQMSFSDTQITQVQQTNTQSSQVFINLQTFQMAATFVQVGSGGPTGQNLTPATIPNFQPISLPDTQSLFSALDKTLQNQASLVSSAVTNPQPTSQGVSSDSASAQDSLNQNFKNLVQMLVQAGASQAVLTTILSQQKDLSSADLKQSLSQNISMDSLLKSITPNVSIPPVSRPESTTISNNSADNARPSVTGQMLVEQMFAQASIATVETQVVSTVVPNAPVQQQDLQVTAEQIFAQDSIVTVETQATPTAAPNAPNAPQPGSQVASVVVPNTPNSSGPEPQVLMNPNSSSLSKTPQIPMLVSPGKAPVVDIQVLNTINNVVARLNVLATQGVGITSTNPSVNSGSKPSISLEQILSALNTQPLQANSNLTALNIEPNTVSAIVPNPLPESIKVSEAEIIAINQFIQSQTAFRSQSAVPETPNQVSVVQQNTLDITSISQVQLIQAAAVVPPEQSQAISNLTVDQALPITDTSSVLSNVSNENAQVIASSPLNNTAVTTTFNIPATVSNQLPVDLRALVQPAPTASAPVVHQAQPVSPVSITVQETVSPNSVDVQVKITDQVPVTAAGNVQVPTATTTATTIPVSTAQNVPASVVAGEAVKLTMPTPNPVKNADSNNLQASNGLSTVSEVKPITLQAVSPVVSGSSPSTDLKVLIDQAKNTNNNSTQFQLNPNLLSNPANLILDKTNVAPIVSSQANNNVPTNKVDSFQILNQVTSQITAHASEARAVSRLSFQLIPESLGRVTVQIALVDQSISARIIVSNPDVKDSLQHHMIDLKTALNQAGLQIDQLQVQVQGGSSNLLAQYYQYQQEGFGYRLPAAFTPAPPDEAKTLENTGLLGEMSVRMSLLDVLA